MTSDAFLRRVLDAAIEEGILLSPRMVKELLGVTPTKPTPSVEAPAVLDGVAAEDVVQRRVTEAPQACGFKWYGRGRTRQHHFTITDAPTHVCNLRGKHDMKQDELHNLQHRLKEANHERERTP